MDQELFLKNKIKYCCRETKTIVGIANALGYGKQNAEIVWNALSLELLG